MQHFERKNETNFQHSFICAETFQRGFKLHAFDTLHLAQLRKPLLT